MARWTPGVGDGLGRMLGLLAVLLCLTPTIASGDSPQAAAGIDRARAAGIEVDPAAEALMKAAPLGSCLNDPTQARCPAANAIVKADTSVNADGSLGYAPLTGAQASSTRRGHYVRAHTAAQFQCAVRANSPWYSVGFAWGSGANQCTAAASHQELYVTLQRVRYDDGTWANLNTASASGPGGTTIRATTSYNCGHPEQRQYRTQAEGYSVVQGIWYASMQRWATWMACP